MRGAIARYGVAAAVHAAADLDDTPEAAVRNREVCASFVRACAASGVRRLVLTSSAAVYGAGPTGPIAETRPPAPQRPYPDFDNSAFSRPQVIDLMFARAKGRHHKVPTEVDAGSVF